MELCYSFLFIFSCICSSSQVPTERPSFVVEEPSDILPSNLKIFLFAFFLLFEVSDVNFASF